LSITAHAFLLVYLGIFTVSNMTDAQFISGMRQSARIELVSAADAPMTETYEVPLAVAVETMPTRTEVEPQRPCEPETETSQEFPEIEQVATQDHQPVAEPSTARNETIRRQAELVDHRETETTDCRPTPQRTSLQLCSLPKSIISEPQAFGIDNRTPPELLSNPLPKYPEEAQYRGLEGVVLLRMEVKPDGTVGRIELVKSCSFTILDQAAIETVREWNFHPAKIFGNPVMSTAILPVRFRIKR